MKCAVFFCKENSEYVAEVAVAGISDTYLLCHGHAHGERKVNGEIKYMIKLDTATEEEKAQSALATVLNRLADQVFHDDGDQPGSELRCAHCQERLYEVEDGDWLECLVVKGFEHKCKKGES